MDEACLNVGKVTDEVLKLSLIFTASRVIITRFPEEKIGWRDWHCYFKTLLLTFLIVFYTHLISVVIMNLFNIIPDSVF